ncbi:HIT domain-containing protein [Aureimonas sp. ME7]|uniref:HIT domain-containing protein n=1 Tax=Aureimonas sp. ME7 TaxID=2744252 RepID=UPI0015F3F881|nr:HIT domain-containing protein [Aureimonas sp. ME7]
MQAEPGTFFLDPRLAADTRPIADLPLCRLLLMNDARWPWVILVPRREKLVELFDMTAEDRTRLFEEANAAARALADFTRAEKINIGTLGNMVRQLHVHVVARSTGDPNWHRPNWGFETARPYAPGEADALTARMQDLAV